MMKTETYLEGLAQSKESINTDWFHLGVLWLQTKEARSSRQGAECGKPPLPSLVNTPVCIDSPVQPREVGIREE